ncbi:phosphoadenosine phosphosulfate reductase [Cokeromyces recurvatus]|uniref:phosphoadenosine phosphosulfate reductase n=1 Tax=Cokeromyces recurvatus TaxID=90255 RepID=UPI00222097DA|nr:phosphoadenosine phosphosulfate reductase [Cokeromyces recurvatus]KAI7904265.1 phosphoadenosine phosphosulfate reductase [Cokeromyces recurvatus]
MPSTCYNRKIESSADLTLETLNYLNDYLKTLEPNEILEWAIHHLPNLYQTTAFGLTGLVILDLIHQISIKMDYDQQQQQHLIPLIFLDTLYHFKETLNLADHCQRLYQVPLLIYRPVHNHNTVTEFEAEFGQQLWLKDEDSYDYLVKVEPAHRAYEENHVMSIITGRRRSQRGDREGIPILEVDSTGLIKLNPLAYWDFKQVWSYIDAHQVPYNALVDQGYRSIGDWHSTHSPSHDGEEEEDENERSGRWVGQQKTECGLHKDYFKMRSAFMASKKKRETQQRQPQQNAITA